MNKRYYLTTEDMIKARALEIVFTELPEGTRYDTVIDALQNNEYPTGSIVWEYFENSDTADLLDIIETFVTEYRDFATALKGESMKPE